jgi:RNA polymerase sigma factor (sigma-70 family)
MWKTTEVDYAKVVNVSELNEMQRTQVYWAQFKQGNQQAYATLYSMYAALLLRYGRKIIQDREVVKDCLHDLFVELWRNRQTLGNPESVKNYLLKSMRTKLYKKLKGDKWVLTDHMEEENPEVQEASPEFALIQEQFVSQQRQTIENGLKQLSKRQREIIFLLFYEEMSPNEVATVMSLTVRTVYNTTYNAIQVLKKSIPIQSALYSLATLLISIF